jgi:hypothetical protein
MIKQGKIEEDKTPSIETGCPCKFVSEDGEPTATAQQPEKSIEKVAKILEDK